MPDTRNGRGSTSSHSHPQRQGDIVKLGSAITQMPPKSSQGGKPQPTISSFFAKKAVAGPSDARPAQPPTSNSIEPSEPPQKRLKTSEDEDSTTTTASRGKDVRRADRVEQWRYVPPPTTQTAEDQAMSVDALPSSSQRSEDEDNRHQAFRKKLLGSDDPIRRRDRQRDEARQAEEREEGRGNAGEDNSAPIAISEDEDDDLPNTNSLNKFSRNGSANTQTTKSSASKGKAKVKYTPLEQQVLELKAKHPDVLLLFEVGYKFIAYEEDAVNASKELNIACFPKNVSFELRCLMRRLQGLHPTPAVYAHYPAESPRRKHPCPPNPHPRSQACGIRVQSGCCSTDRNSCTQSGFHQRIHAIHKRAH